jgi:hypothetical protein
MAVTTSNPSLEKKGGRIRFGIDDERLSEPYFGYTHFEFGDDPNGPIAVILVIPPDIEFALYYHDTEYIT